MAIKTSFAIKARIALSTLLVSGLLGFTSPASAEAKSILATSAAHVSAPDKHGRSALFITLTNTGSLPITLLSVTSPSLGMAMFFVDPNLQQPASPFVFAPSFRIAPHSKLTLSARGKGMMLSRWHHEALLTNAIPLTFHWFGTSVEQTAITATWLQPSPTLYFHYTSMVM